MGKEAKTNAMRMLERAKVNYTSHEYPHEEGQAVDGAHVAQLTGQDPAKVFKTLVTQGADRNYYVFVVPVLAELDLEESRQERRREKRCHDSCGRHQQGNRLHPRRVQSRWHEKAVCHRV